MTIEELDLLVTEAIVLKGIIEPICDTYGQFYKDRGLPEGSLGECYLYYNIAYLNYVKHTNRYWTPGQYLEEIAELTKYIKEGYSIYHEVPHFD